jgi:hypothetical protein
MSEGTMKQDLTTLLCAVPFVPFTVKTIDGETYNVDSVGRMCVGNDICAFVDAEGSLLAIPFHTIGEVIVGDCERPHSSSKN